MGLTSVAIAIPIFGVLYAAIGVVCLIGYRRTRQKPGLVGLVPTCAVVELAARLPSEPMKLKGIARCATPLTSEVAGRPCVYYRSVTAREYLVSGGRGVRRRKSETISENEQRLPFLLEDATGQVAVDPAEAEIDGRKLVDRFEPYRGEPAASITVGGIAIDLSGDARTLGYRWVEHAVPVDAPRLRARRAAGRRQHRAATAGEPVPSFPDQRVLGGGTREAARSAIVGDARRLRPEPARRMRVPGDGARYLGHRHARRPAVSGRHPAAQALHSGASRSR